MNQQKSSHELSASLISLKPFFKKAMLFSIAVNVLVLAPTVYMLEVYDRVVNSRSVETLVMLTVLVLVAYGLMEVCEWVRRELLGTAGDVLDEKLAQRVFSSVFQANLRQLKVGGAAVFGDFKVLKESFSTPAVLAALDAPASLFFVVIIFFINPILGAISLSVAAIQLLLTYLTERTTRSALSEASRAAVMAQSYAIASLRNAEVVHAMGMRSSVHDRWMSIQEKHLGLQADASNQVASTSASGKFFQLLQGSLLIGLGAWLTIIGEFPGGGGMMMVASIIAGRATAPIGQVIMGWKSISAVQQAYRRLDSLLSAIPDAPHGMSLPAPEGRLVVEAVSACPPGANNILLKNISFSVQPGTVLGIIGPSASGKSTLARLIVGVWQSNAGKVRLDGVDVSQWNKNELGPSIGYLPQDVELFDGTIAENIARFGVVDYKKIEDAANRAGLIDWVKSLEGGFETNIGDGGEALSGGQRQRIALARAIYGRPRLLVLDEPNANLDEEGERQLAVTLSHLKQEGSSVVVITHRTGILNIVDCLMILKDGSIAANGPRDQVLASLSQPVVTKAA